MSISERLNSVQDKTEIEVFDFVEIREDVNQLQLKFHKELVEELGDKFEEGKPSDELLYEVDLKLTQYLNSVEIPLSFSEKGYVKKAVMDNLFGYGPLEEFLKNTEVTEVMVNGHASIYVEKGGKIYKTGSRFIDENHLMRIIEKIVAQVGRRIDESSPMVDARLSDGSRVNAIIPPLALDGSLLTIRKFAADPFTAEDLIAFNTISRRLMDFLKACVEGRLNIIISGGTGTGKTTTLNVLSSFIPEDERIITIEDAAELQLRQEHLLRLESRPPNIEGKGIITIRDLVRNSLRMRPDRIIVGEARGGEALDMLQAMNTGHDGSLSTIHSNSPRDALARIETMVLMAGMDLPSRAIREQTASAIDLIVHISRLRDGSRRVTHITEVQGMEGDIITLQDIFLFDYSMGIDSDGKYKGIIKSTGIRPKFLSKLSEYGIELSADIFSLEIN